jgi:hypothetical protein
MTSDQLLARRSSLARETLTTLRAAFLRAGTIREQAEVFSGLLAAEVRVDLITTALRSLDDAASQAVGLIGRALNASGTDPGRNMADLAAARVAYDVLPVLVAAGLSTERLGDLVASKGLHV